MTSGQVEECVKPKKNRIIEQLKQIDWRRLTIAFVAFAIIASALAYVVERVILGLDLPLGINWLSYAVVFGVSIVTNLSVLVPVPLALNFMALAVQLGGEPLLIAGAGALGGAIGELSGYYAGRLGQKMAIPEGIAIYKTVEGWVNRWGFWAILALALQPVIPFDIGGFIAGAARMPVRKFFPALVLGKFPKYLFIIYAYLGLVRFLPFLQR